MVAIRRPPLESALETSLWVVLAATVVLFACGSSSLATAVTIGHTVRWVMLAVDGAVAVPLAMATGWSAAGTVRRFATLPYTYVALALLSVAWSPRPRLSFERACSLGLLFTVALALAVAGVGRAGVRRAILGGLALGASAVGLAGVLMIVVGSPAARIAASGSTPWRFRGFGMNPNTTAVLAAVALPLVAWLVLTSAGRVPRIAWAASFLILLGSTVASESRGGLAGVLVGVSLVLLLLVDPWPRKLVYVSVFAVVVVGGVALRQAQQQTPPAFVSAVQPGIGTTTPGSTTTATPTTTSSPAPASTTPGNAKVGQAPGKTTTPRPHKAHQTPPPVVAMPLPQRTDEIGNPGLSRAGVSNLGSGRIAAWEGALKLVRVQPLLGYGFGMEDTVFVDRWAYFEGARPENSIIGILLELGAVGLLVMAAILAAAVRLGIRTIRVFGAERPGEATACLGVVAAAVVVTFVQSYLYSVGNIATATVWISVFLLAAVASPVAASPATGRGSR